ncbi:MAG: protein kinase, partial [Candidatus Krumholzibacteria bacterium]|nr:protein kinase [Candidatus Krumholzibacteria bacterium]
MDRKKLAGYEILGKLGEGGMGVVYRARDTTLDRLLAIKVIPPERLGPQGKGRFLREARICSRINHPNIVTVYTAGEEDGYPFMAMELLEGQTLREIIDEGPVPWEKALRWIVDILDALERFHREGIVHRDLKPENIMVTPDGVVKLMDFGIAHIPTSETLTMEGTTVGTVFYMSPEQVLGKKADVRSDIFSIGAVLYQMLTGAYPFEGEHPMATMYSITNESPEPTENFVQNLPEGLATILDHALEKDPHERFPDAGSMKNALLDLLQVEELARTQVSKADRRRTYILRIVLLTALLLAVAIIIIAQLFQGRGVEGNRALAKHHNQLAQNHERAGKIKEAELEYRNAIIADPEWEVPWNNLGMLAIGKGDLPEADSLLNRAISIKPDYAAVLYNLGTVRWDRNDFESAVRLFGAALKADPSFILAYNNLGALLLELDRAEDARAVLDMG